MNNDNDKSEEKSTCVPEWSVHREAKKLRWPILIAWNAGFLPRTIAALQARDMSCYEREEFLVLLLFLPGLLLHLLLHLLFLLARLFLLVLTALVQ